MVIAFGTVNVVPHHQKSQEEKENPSTVFIMELQNQWKMQKDKN